MVHWICKTMQQNSMAYSKSIISMFVRTEWGNKNNYNEHSQSLDHGSAPGIANANRNDSKDSSLLGCDIVPPHWASTYSFKESQCLSSWFRASSFSVNKNPTRCSSMQIFIYCKATLHVLGVTAPIIRSTKNCNRSLRYRSYYWYRRLRLQFLVLLMMGAVTPETCRVALQ